MNLTGSEKAVRVLRELVGMWDKVSAGLKSVRKITGSGIAEVKQSADGIVIHVPGPAADDLESGTGLIGKWVLVNDFQDTFAHDRNVYIGDVYRSLNGPAAARTSVAIINSWEIENTSSVKAGYTIVTSTPNCGDIIGINPLPTYQWYQIVGVIEEDGDRYAVISQRNDPTIEPPA